MIRENRWQRLEQVVEEGSTVFLSEFFLLRWSGGSRRGACIAA